MTDDTQDDLPDDMPDDMQADMQDDRALDADDARLQSMLDREARAYHAPPATAPRDEMWSAIRTRLDARHDTTGVTPISVTPISVTPISVTPISVTPISVTSRRRGWTRHTAWGAVAAATLVAGVGLGRLTRRDALVETRSLTPAAIAAVAATPTDSTPPVSGATELPAQTAVTAKAPSTVAASGSRLSSGSRAAATTSSGSSVTADRTAPLAYRDAAAVHLAAAEALLVALHSPSEGVSGDTAISAWAGDLLGTTRVMLDSPAARDRRTRELLQDLELVLAQIARLRADAPADGRGVSDRALIDQAIRQRQMLTRLRASGA